ncbi:hypothetical protein HZH68_000063 [Vespula germanica]|uniref:Uncharacterized protein n=1 Tax=Vespula germanica TaxID=30212 RepID=A0A834NT12_VESGE|nr:hypothetical protein HZH68_000063 [Vespula germanica]
MQRASERANAEDEDEDEDDEDDEDDDDDDDDGDDVTTQRENEAKRYERIRARERSLIKMRLQETSTSLSAEKLRTEPDSARAFQGLRRIGLSERRHGSRRGTPPVVTVRKGDTVQRPRFHPHGYPAIGARMKEPTSLTKTTRDHRSFDPAPLSAEYLGPFSRTLRIREEARSEDNPAKRNEIQVARRGGEQRGKGAAGIATKATAEKTNGREASFLIY